MFDAGVSIHHHRQVVLQQRTAFRHHHDADIARSSQHHLALVATRLVVALDADRADRLQALQVTTRIVDRFDLCFEAALSTVQDRARRPSTRRKNGAGAR